MEQKALKNYMTWTNQFSDCWTGSSCLPKGSMLRPLLFYVCAGEPKRPNDGWWRRAHYRSERSIDPVRSRLWWLRTHTPRPRCERWQPASCAAYKHTQPVCFFFGTLSFYFQGVAVNHAAWAKRVSKLELTTGSCLPSPAAPTSSSVKAPQPPAATPRQL